MGGVDSLLLNRSTALLLTVLGACGGRTGFELNDPYVDASPAAAGSTASGRGSSGTTASGGAAGITASGSKPSISTAGSASEGRPDGLTQSIGADCRDYCNVAANPPCPLWDKVSDCQRDCEALLGPRSWDCQRAGANYLSCRLAAFANSPTCADIEQNVATRCSGPAREYGNCFDAVPTPPTPSCSTSGRAPNYRYCTLSAKCDSGEYYQVSCSQTGADQSTCSCTATFADGSAKDSARTLDLLSPSACEETLLACGFPAKRFE